MKDFLNHSFRHACTVLCGLLMLATIIGCTKDPIILPNPDEEQPSGAPLVIVIYGPNSLGDRSYCDMIYSGVERAAKKHGLRTLQFSPENDEEGLAYLETIISEMEQNADTVRRLLITPGVGYDTYIRANSHRLESNPRADLLYMETTTPLESKGSTLYIDYYGAMYMGGCMVHYTTYDYDKELVSLVLANPHTQSVREAGEGFVAGFNDSQGLDSLTLHIRYLSQEPVGGFTLSDTAAIRIIREESTYLYEDSEGITVVPVCGGAMHSLMRAIRGTQLFATNQYIGIDGDMNADNFFCPFSIVKHVDVVMEDYIGMWLEGTMPKHQTLGLADGATGVIVGNYFMPNDLNLIDIDSLWQVAVGKEAGRWIK
jgi:basic membrane protein A